jgi:hypothetical protein
MQRSDIGSSLDIELVKQGAFQPEPLKRCIALILTSALFVFYIKLLIMA